MGNARTRLAGTGESSIGGSTGPVKSPSYTLASIPRCHLLSSPVAKHGEDALFHAVLSFIAFLHPDHIFLHRPPIKRF